MVSDSTYLPCRILYQILLPKINNYIAVSARYHMYPKDFTIVCIINTVLEPAPLFMR